MAISSFFGLQTSLRGLIATQRMMDTTGHNIANTSTEGYSRQEATLSASQAMVIPAGGTANGAGASIGAGVDVQSYRRVRDQFLDLQYRSQNTTLNDASARSGALDTAELSLAEPSENGINEQLQKFWSSWSDLANASGDPAAAKQALVEQGSALADSLQGVRSQMTAAQGDAAAQYADLTRPASAGDAGGDIAQIATELAGLNKTISGFTTAGDAPNDLLDRRDVLLDKLSGYGQVSVDNLTTGSTNVSFVDSQTGVKYPIVNDQAASWSGPPAADNWSPGGQLGGLLTVSKPGGTIDGYLGSLDTIATSLASAVNSAYGGSFFTTGTPAGATLAVDSALTTNPNLINAGPSGSNSIALAVSQLRGTASIDGAYKAFVAKVGSDVSQADRQQANAQVLTDSVSDRRASVSGVSMDEEMTNMVKFQRSYQASARAMTTMDDMLDVLINRTGRVGI
jgi:flagellar hook-associated protein 1 FlgK